MALLVEAPIDGGLADSAGIDLNMGNRSEIAGNEEDVVRLQRSYSVDKIAVRGPVFPTHKDSQAQTR